MTPEDRQLTERVEQLIQDCTNIHGGFRHGNHVAFCGRCEEEFIVLVRTGGVETPPACPHCGLPAVLPETCTPELNEVLERNLARAGELFEAGRQHGKRMETSPEWPRCTNCGHADPHTRSTAGGGPHDPYDGCTHAGCHCGYYGEPMSALDSARITNAVENAPEPNAALVQAFAINAIEALGSVETRLDSVFESLSRRFGIAPHDPDWLRIKALVHK